MGESKRRQKLDPNFGNPVKTLVEETADNKWLCVAMILGQREIISQHNHVEEAIEQANEVLVKFNRYSTDVWRDYIKTDDSRILLRAFLTLDFDEEVGKFAITVERRNGRQEFLTGMTRAELLDLLNEFASEEGKEPILAGTQ